MLGLYSRFSLRSDGLSHPGGGPTYRFGSCRSNGGGFRPGKMSEHGVKADTKNIAGSLISLAVNIS